MDEDLSNEISTDVDGTAHQFYKLILGTGAGFLAGKLVQNLYDAAIIAYRNR